MLVVYSFLGATALAGLYVAAKHLISNPEHINDNPRRHLYVLLAFFPLSYLLAALLPHMSRYWVQFLNEQSQYFGSEGIYVKMVSAMRPVSLIGTPNGIDILTMVLFWFTTYGVMIVLKRLVDINRVLKVSRKRLKEML